MLLGKQIRHVAEFTEDVQGIVSIDHFDLEQISVARMEAYRFGKRLLDILLVVVAVPLAAPLLMLGMCMVLIKMGRPIFFVQPRVGLGGQPFQMYKLRTMRIANHAEGVRATSSGDSRVTKVGKILRRFRIDELPQLLNVLKGDMSVIGPRPEQPMLTQEYERELPAFVYRSLVRPGITGWAQVRAGYAANLEETRVKLTYDLFYIKNFSFALDMQILFRTIWTLASGVGAR
jgi:lipopolysaccharide/colanic/teichoic acid biosynthesis glycosyltransferase